MKKIVSIFAAALLAAGFMGCSNDSDDNSALLLALSSKNSSSASLPASVGENELTDKKFKTEVTDEIIARYNRAQKLSDKKILREAYSVVSYGSFTIKYATSNNIPDFTSEPKYPLVVE